MMRCMTERTPRGAAGTRRWWALVVLCLSLVVVTIDTTILNVALPSLVSDLHASASQLQWVVDAYTVVFAGLLLSAGSVGDRFGRRGTLAAGLVVFGGACAASALSRTPEQLIALRALTGAGAALVFPATLSLLTSIFTEPVERQRAIAIWAGTAGIGIGLGPVAGGLLLRWASWSSVFWVNVPLCAAALVAGRFLLPAGRDHGGAPLDPPGALLSVAGLSSLVYGVIEGPSRGWSSTPVLAGLLGGAALLAAFVAVELRRAHPMLDLRLFRDPRFSAASLAVTTLYFCLFGTIFFQTQHLQVVLGYDPLGAGLRSVPFAVVLLVVANTTPRLVARLGARPLIATGLLLVAASMAGRATFSVDTTYTGILVTQCLFALGMGLTIAPATASIMAAVPAARAGVGSAINDTTRQVGGALGVAVLGSVGASLYRHDLAARLAGHLAGPVPTSALDSVGGAAQAARHLPPADGQLLVDAARHAFVHGLDVAAVVAVVVALLGAGLAARFLPARTPAAVLDDLPTDALAVEVAA